MRHHSKIKKFGRERNQRRALMRSLALSLIEHGKIVTSEAKAKALRPAIEKMITTARSGDTASVRLIMSRLANNEKATTKLVKEIAPKYKDRRGGYTRVIKLGTRSGRGDAAQLAVIELV